MGFNAGGDVSEKKGTGSLFIYDMMTYAYIAIFFPV